MTTLLDSVLKRELTIGGEPYTLTISPEGFSLTVKGRRNGLDIAWADLIGGDAALATALNASLTANFEPRGSRVSKQAEEKSAAQDDQRAAKQGAQQAGAAEKLEKKPAAKPTHAKAPLTPRGKASLKLVEPQRKPAAKRKRK